MQTKQQIQKLLASAGVNPNKRLGQNFLIDLNLIQLLVDTAHITANDVVLEVGCGTGSLTSALAPLAGRVVAVEYDSTLAKIAAEQLKSFDNIEIINADVLESKNTINHTVIEALEKCCEQFFGRVLLIANLPYSVGSAVILNLITGPIIADEMFITVQKEVADRMAAAPGTDEYGILSILVSVAGDAHIFRKLSKKVFWPAPQVESAMLRFDRNKKKVSRIYDFDLFKQVVHLFMGHRRKMIRSCVKFAEGPLADIHNWHDIFERSFIELHNRPEQLTPEEYISIANLCYETLH